MLAHKIDLKKLRFGLSIVGLPVIETTISDTLKVAKNFNVILFSGLMGLAVGLFSSVMLYFNGQVWHLPLLIFPATPILINFLANYLAAIYLMVIDKVSRSQKTFKKSKIRTVVSIYVPSQILWSLILILQKKLDPETEINLLIIISAPIVYVIISEVVHHFIYRYMIHDIEQEYYPAARCIQNDVLPDSGGKAEGAGSFTENHVKEVEIGTLKFKETDIILLEAQGNYLKIVTSSGEFTERCLMSTVVEELDCGVGLQVHRSFWISFKAVLALVRVDGSLCVRLTSGYDIKIARPRQKVVRQKLAERGIFLDVFPP